MKYYLFKSDNCEILDVMFEGYLGKKIELTEEELQAIANEKIHLSSTVDFITGTDKIRKVLE